MTLPRFTLASKTIRWNRIAALAAEFPLSEPVNAEFSLDLWVAIIERPSQLKASFRRCSCLHLRINPPPIFRRVTPPPPSELRWPINHASLMALLATVDFGGRMLFSTCRMRMCLLPRLTSFGTWRSMSDSFDFLRMICLSMSKGGVGRRMTDSVASNSSGSRAGRDVFADFVERL